MTISLQVCNLALGLVRADEIVSSEEDTVEARACSRFYPMALRSLLEVCSWSFATAVAPLAEVGNDRPAEWPHAFALPLNLGQARRLVPTGIVSSIGYFYPWPRSIIGQPYVISAGKLYTRTAAPSLEYGMADLAEDQMPMQFQKALAFELATYLAVAVLNDSRLKGELIQQAEVEKQRAVAADRNRQPHSEADWDWRGGPGQWAWR